jgi:GNAT superfamily N-acetyltransferase
MSLSLESSEAPTSAAKRYTAGVFNIETRRLSLSPVKPEDGLDISPSSISLTLRNEDNQFIGNLTLSEDTAAPILAQILAKILVQKRFGPTLSLNLTPQFQNQGYGLEALEALIATIRRHSLYKCLHASHGANNKTAARLLIKAGFLYTGQKSSASDLDEDSQKPVLHMVRLI